MIKAFVPLLFFFFMSSAAFSQTSRAELEKKKNKLVKEIGSLQAELDKTKKNKNATLAQVTALKKKIAARETLIGTFAAEINTIDRDISKTKTQISSEAARLKDLQIRYARSVHYNYKHMGAYDGLMFVLASQSFNEAFLRLIDARRVAWHDRAHFLGISARLMRRILVDHARTRDARKRGDGDYKVSLDENIAAPEAPKVDLVDLDRALDALTAVDERKSRVIEMRFFGGMTVEETAEVLHVSIDTVKRDWRLAKLWLLRELDH